MKKILVTIVLITLIPTISNANVLGNYLSTKDGNENRIYNLVVESYNNFKRKLLFINKISKNGIVWN